MWITIGILILAAAFFVAGKVRSDVVALCSLIGLLVFQILTPEEALSGFSNQVVIMMVGLFVVGGAIVQTGLAKMISSRILKLAGTSELRLFLLVMLVTSGIGAFVSNTGDSGPDAAHRGKPSQQRRRQSAPTAHAAGLCREHGWHADAHRYAPQPRDTGRADGSRIRAAGLLHVPAGGVVCVLTGTLVLLPLTKWFLSDKGRRKEETVRNKSLRQLVEEYGLSSNLFRLQAVQRSPIIGQNGSGAGRPTQVWPSTSLRCAVAKWPSTGS